ncbi:MAG: Holliday junction resolvase RuvX [Candidatus Kapaibacterium sp.]
MTSDEREPLRGKRLMAFDFGLKRIGVAVCDELHIIVSTRPVIDNTPQVLDEVKRRVMQERCEALFIGVPRLHDDRSTPIIEAALAFISSVREHVSIPVFEVDEAFSTQEARQRMIRSGMKKKQRQQRGVKDQFAAAVILDGVLEELRSSRPLGGH